MNIRKNYNHTLNACYLGYITQAIVNNFAPLLFLTFQSTYEISLDKIALLVSFNFVVQLIVDLLAAKYVDKIGYRNSVVAAHIFGAYLSCDTSLICSLGGFSLASCCSACFICSGIMGWRDLALSSTLREYSEKQAVIASACPDLKNSRYFPGSV